MYGDRFAEATDRLIDFFNQRVALNDKMGFITFNNNVRVAFSLTSKKKNLGLMTDKLQQNKVQC